MIDIVPRIFDCRQVAEDFKGRARQERLDIKRPPKLALVLFKPAAGEASVKYRDLILQDARALDVETESLEPTGEAELLASLGHLNEDRSVSGILVFYPIGGDLPDEDLMDLVSPRKDVEGLHSLNLGYLVKYKRFLDAAHRVKCVVPATAKAIVKTLQAHEVKIEGSFCAVVNNSMRVGKPLGLMLENLGATVVNAHDKTRPEDLESCVRRADILVTAVPDPAFMIETDWIKPGAAIIDASYKGNIDYESVKTRAGLLSSPENRIGQVTRAILFVNLLYCARALEFSGFSNGGPGRKRAAISYNKL